MKDEKDVFKNLLKSMPNARPAKHGVLIESNGVTLHLTGLIKNSDFEGLGDDAAFYATFCSREDIERIMRPAAPNDFLLKLRADAIVDNPRLVRVFKHRKGKKQNWSLEGYYSGNEREREYVSHLSKGNQEKLKDVPAGSAYLNYANAICMKTEAGNVIAVSEPLEHFLYFMNIFYYGDDFGIKEIDRFHAFLIAQRTMAGHESLDFDIDPRATLPARVDFFISSITDLQYQFILGHEYSHHLLGHLNDSRLRSEKLSNLINMHEGNKTIRHYEYSHKMEYDADWYAIKNIKGDGEYREAIANSAFLALMYFESKKIILDHVSPKLNFGHSSHPDPVSRIYKLRAKLNNRKGFSRDQIENNIEFLRKYTNDFVGEYLVFNYDEFESYGSVYMPNYKERILKDRVDF